jgi:hypothetical protein
VDYAQAFLGGPAVSEKLIRLGSLLPLQPATKQFLDSRVENCPTRCIPKHPRFKERFHSCNIQTNMLGFLMEK